jgi:hypothetical protein
VANKIVSFKVTPSAAVTSYWIAIDKVDVPLNAGAGRLPLSTGERHTLIWWFEGSTGAKIGIKGTAGQQTVVEVKESKIPDGEHKANGGKRFQL